MTSIENRIGEYHEYRIMYRGNRNIEGVKDLKSKIKFEYDLTERDFQKELIKYVKSLSTDY